ncbi:MAG TPA: hypothetical protein VGR62_06905 [Candidatus Binatia bacterium]|jgi:hypothetical protein|nr:hypothetical protein [Candidatus Binatia bacterium]
MRMRPWHLALLVVVTLVSCVGQTDDATNITPTGAVLHATGTCTSGSCSYYFRLWPVEVGEPWGISTPVRTLAGMPPNTTAAVLPETVSGLRPDTRYRFRACGKEASESQFQCAATKDFTTAPPPQIPTLTATLTAPNTVTLRWATSGGLPGQSIHLYGAWHDPATGTYFEDVGFRTDQQNPTGLSFRTRFGRHRYVLSLPTATGDVLRAVEIDVLGPSAPNVATPTVNLFSGTLADTTIGWDNPTSGHFVRIAIGADRFTTAVGAASYTFPKAYLEGLGLGAHRVDMTTCRSMTGQTPKMSGDFCGDRTTIFIEIGGAAFTGPARVHVATGDDATVSWTPTGQFFFLDAPSLGIYGQVIVGTSRTFANVPAGIHTVELGTCSLYPPKCANLATAAASAAGTVDYLATAGEFPLGVAAGTVVARIRRPDQSIVSITAPASGAIHYTHVAVGNAVTVGEALLSVQTAAFARMQLLVADQTFEHRALGTDFSPWLSAAHVLPEYSHVNLGNTMPVLAAADGTLWAGGEFAEGSVLSVTGDWTVGYTMTPFVAPVLRKSQGGRLVPVKPFARLSGLGESVTKEERVIEAGPYIWFINGGSSDPSATPDWNRLVRFDRSGTDNPATFQDERFCVFHVPFEGANVMGIEWDDAAHRLWYVESRLPNAAVPVLAWFDPDELTCEANLLDYSNPTAVAAASTHYCSTPSETHCIHTVPLVDTNDAAKRLTWAAHVALGNGAVWVAGFFSNNIARYDRASGRVDVLPAPRSMGLTGFVGTGPWQLLAHDDYLYFTEFFDGDVVRLDTQAFAANPAQCKSLAPNGSNPCMSEIHAGSQLKELDIDGDRLYFAGYQDFGYIDLPTWTPGVIYDGLDAVRDPERRKRGELLSGDMSVGPSGVVVLNDYTAHELYRLYPQ